ncbi:pantoate-beta-alanine ligase [Malassezia pachydermatis]
MAAYRLSAHMPGVPVRTFENAQVFRAWRRTILHSNKTVGFVPTMGALHEGHLQLVDASLQANDYTVVSIFVNPAQFAPHEDLSTYPRTLHHDLEQLGQREAAANVSGSLVVLVPQVSDMYPHGITQNVDEQVGAFIEMAGLSQYMEGTTRPTFFRGVATIVTKLFNLVLPDHAYFGQKDIQQAIIIRRMVDDLLFTFPMGAERVHIVPTVRDPKDSLALSSRNKYLDTHGRQVAPLLYRALSQGKQVWESMQAQGVPRAERVHATLAAAQSIVTEATALPDQVARVQLDYVSLNDPRTLQVLSVSTASPMESAEADSSDPGAILSGAMWVYNHANDEKPAARLIDNVLLGFSLT